MARIVLNQWCIRDSYGVMVDLDNRARGRLYLYGKRNDSVAFLLGNEEYITAAIKEIVDNKVVITYKGEYELGVISPDYHEFLKASARGNTVIANWNILGSHEQGYFLIGDIVPKRKFLARPVKIIRQENNFLCIRKLTQNESGDVVWHDDEQEQEMVFVCWDSMSQQVKNQLKLRGKVADIAYSKFQEFNGTICKPLLNIAEN